MLDRNPPSIVMTRSLMELDDNGGARFGAFFSKEISGYLFLNEFFIIFMDEDKRVGGGDAGIGGGCGVGGG
ncbi:hypothetical protein AMTRI_Chr04g246140 [Amborella trichopoda]